MKYILTTIFAQYEGPSSESVQLFPFFISKMLLSFAFQSHSQSIASLRQEFTLFNGEANVRCLLTPGHTQGHICYYVSNEQKQSLIFSGDCLFKGGVGKFFEGSAADMHVSLTKLALLPDDTAVYCGHEYTVSNYNFAINCDEERIRGPLDNAVKTIAAGGHTIPSTMGEEKKSNLFLRAVCCSASENELVAKAVGMKAQNGEDAIAASIKLLGAIREAKNNNIFKK
jgi:hydroxyacylglutathione hydrolase